MATKKIEPVGRVCMGNKSNILKCNGLKSDSQFYSSKSEFYDGKMIYCKDCCNQIFKYYYEKTNNPQTATYYTCQKLDVPFKAKLFEQTFASYQERNKSANAFLDFSNKFFGNYIADLNRRTKEYAKDTDFSFSDADLSNIDTKIAERENYDKQLKELKVIWGEQDSVEDYMFLQDRFEEYTQGVNFSNAFHKDLYRDLCRDRLLLRKISEKRYDIEDISKVQKRVSELSSQLKVNEFEANKPKTPSQLALFEKIKLVDGNNVNDIYKNPTIKYDLNQIEKYEKDCVLRPTLKALINHRDYDLKMEDLEQYDIK